MQITDHRKQPAEQPEIVYGRWPGRRHNKRYPGARSVWHIFQAAVGGGIRMTRCGKVWTMDATLTAKKPKGDICARCTRMAPETK